MDGPPSDAQGWAECLRQIRGLRRRIEAAHREVAACRETMHHKLAELEAGVKDLVHEARENDRALAKLAHERATRTPRGRRGSSSSSSSS